MLEILVTLIAILASVAVAFLPPLPSIGLPSWIFFGQIWPTLDDLGEEIRLDRFLKLFVWIASLIAVVFVWARG